MMLWGQSIIYSRNCLKSVGFSYSSRLDSLIRPQVETLRRTTLITQSNIQQVSSSLQESAFDTRFTRYTNQIFHYDFKVGNYLSDEKTKMNPNLLTTITDVTMGLRTAP